MERMRAIFPLLDGPRLEMVSYKRKLTKGVIKMAFQEVVTGRKFCKYSECKEGQVVAEGKFVGTSENQYGESYEIETQDGVICLPSAGQLRSIFGKRVGEGSYVRVTYGGKQEIASGKFAGKEAHSFKVEVDNDRSESAADSW